jgi:ribosomal-protein-alanine N-acetyltransferase
MITTARYQVRPMTMGDIPQVTEIEREAFPTTWPPTAYRRELANRLARYLVVSDRTATTPTPPVRGTLRRSFVDVLLGRPVPVATTDQIVGYLGLWLMVDQAHIVAIAVRQDYRGRGLGDLLMAEAIEASLASGVESVTLEVRRSNELAQRLYEKYGFLKVGVRKGYYSDNREDAVVMTTPPMNAGYYRERFAGLKQAIERRLEGAGEA